MKQELVALKCKIEPHVDLQSPIRTEASSRDLPLLQADKQLLLVSPPNLLSSSASSSLSAPLLPVVNKKWSTGDGKQRDGGGHPPSTLSPTSLFSQTHSPTWYLAVKLLHQVRRRHKLTYSMMVISSWWIGLQIPSDLQQSWTPTLDRSTGRFIRVRWQLHPVR